MNDNENKMNNVKQFINEHKTGLIIGACGIVTLASVHIAIVPAIVPEGLISITPTQ